mmetsp:Transcript_150474/g.419259  ORF Transcript_150474/g.419259 Transcript_150474/m.419259 type:complete len:263 (+) Transcript_150474:128-916(+)
MAVLALLLVTAAEAAATAVPQAPPEPLAALPVADDECKVPAAPGSGSSSCALNALQRSRSVIVREASLENHPFISGCTEEGGGKECPTPLSCVAKPDGTWSQCVDCTTSLGFEKDCREMNAEMREAAKAKCDRTCPFTTPRPTTSGCNDTIPGKQCSAGLTCVTTADGSWSQCLDCSRRFYDDCQKLEDNLRLAAVLTCKRTCLGSKCDSQKWCHSPYHCVGNHTWAQCLKCDHRTFHYDCRSWDTAFRQIAERQCKRTCRR